jgi:hypothetical protein
MFINFKNFMLARKVLYLLSHIWSFFILFLFFREGLGVFAQADLRL